MSSDPDHNTALPSGAAPVRTFRIWLLTAVGVLCCAVLAAASLLALMLFFEARDRERLHTHLQQAQSLLARVQDAEQLSSLHARLGDSFASLPDLAVRIQGPQGLALYEQAPQADMPDALLTRPASAPPAPLRQWRTQASTWRGSALRVRTGLEGAAPLTVAVALNVQPQQAFVTRMGWGLGVAWLGMSALLLTLGRYASRSRALPLT